jgi:hypothetical protein
MTLTISAVYFFIFLIVWRSFRIRRSRAVGFGARLFEALFALNWWIMAIIILVALFDTRDA